MHTLLLMTNVVTKIMRSYSLERKIYSPLKRELCTKSIFCDIMIQKSSTSTVSKAECILRRKIFFNQVLQGHKNANKICWPFSHLKKLNVFKKLITDGKLKDHIFEDNKNSYDSQLTPQCSSKKYQTCLGCLKLQTKNATSKIWTTIRSSSHRGY